MSNAFSFEQQPFEAYSEFDEEEAEFNPENFESELTDSEWEEEIRRGTPFSPRGTTGYRQSGRPSPNHLWPRKHPPRGYSPRPLFVGDRVIREPVSCICPVHGTESVRWVQSTLNQILGLRLPVTGIMNAATRSAIRSFQQREGLPVDGIVGPDTERALSAARGGKSPQAGATKPAEPGMAEPAEPVTTLPGPDTAEPTPPAAEFDFEWETFDDERELDFPEYEFEEEVARAAGPFGGDPALHQWATNLTTAWARRVTSKPDEQQREMKKRMDWLAKDYEVTLAGAQKRKGLRNYNLQEIIRAWRISREQHMDFATLDKSKELVNFQPPPVGSVQLVKAKDFVGDSDKYPVAPLVVAFIQKLLQIHPHLRADTYGNHGGGTFRGRGFSIDLWLDHSPKDARGFWRHEDAVALLRAVHQAARAVGAEWRVLYNDYSVARVINQETGARRVAFVGGAFPGGGLNWHGPHPLILHFHLDLVPLPGVVAGARPPMSSIPSQPGVSKPSVASSIASLPKILADAVKSGALTLEAVSRILAGERNVDILTNSIFYARHPELPTGYKIQPHEKGLAREWLDIRERVVRPVLRAMDVKSTSVVSVSTPAAADLPHGPLGTLIAQVPGRPRFSYAFTPEDLLWTARFLTGEAGGQNNLDSHAVIWAMINRYALLTHERFPTFHQFIRAYSTPLQPVLKSWGAARRHMHKKTFVRTGGTYAPKHPEVPRGQLQRHLDLQKAAWSRLPQGARIVAEAALKGQLKNPIGLASEFGSTYVYFHDQHGRYPTDEEWRKYTEAYARGKKWVWVGPIPGLNQKNNALFIHAAVARLPPDTVSVVS